MTSDEWASTPFPSYTEAQETEITRRSPVADVIGEHTSIHRLEDGAYRGACPFCNRPDTLEVFPETGRWRCSNCLETGDVMIFINKFLGLWRADAYKFLADRAGLNFEVGA